MNCKPGDLAVVAYVTSNEIPRHLGRIVRCLQLDGHFREAWITEPELEPGRSVYDRVLRPIRDPGDDATDEMVQLLGKPTEVAA